MIFSDQLMASLQATCTSLIRIINVSAKSRYQYQRAVPGTLLASFRPLLASHCSYDSISPSVTPSTAVPTGIPTVIPTCAPTAVPTTAPSTKQPSVTPTNYPSLSPSMVSIIVTIAGSGTGGYGGDAGPATAAAMYQPNGVALDSSGRHSRFHDSISRLTLASTGNVYIADSMNHRIRKVTVSTGIISTIAGSGASSYSGDGGVATSAGLYLPYGVALSSSGNIYIGEQGSNRVRKVMATSGIISTIAGTGSAGFSGDGGVATAATLKYPWGIAVDTSSKKYILYFHL